VSGRLFARENDMRDRFGPVFFAGANMDRARLKPEMLAVILSKTSELILPTPCPTLVM
jgi:hypothetical protein